MTIPERVRFQFADSLLEGDVVDAELVGSFGGDDWELTVDVGDGLTYPTLASDATPV